MRLFIRVICTLVIVASWIVTCAVGRVAPIVISTPVDAAIRKLEHTDIDAKSAETRNAVRPIFELTERIGDRVCLYSTLMFIGYLGYILSGRKGISPNKSP